MYIYMKNKTPKMIVRVTKTEFETDDGVVHQIPFELDRDLNAARNLKKLYTVSSTGIHALGDGSSSNESSVSPSLKKESNGKFTYVLKRSVDFCKF